MPRIAPAAEQSDTLVEEILTILNWLDSAAQCILDYRHTELYQEARRRAGTMHRVPGITAEEQALRSELRKAHANVQRGLRLAELWDQRAITRITISQSDWMLLQNHWSDINRERLHEIRQRRGNLRITMSSLRLDLPERAIV